MMNCPSFGRELPESGLHRSLEATIQGAGFPLGYDGLF